MYVERLLQILLATTTVLGALLFGMGERSLVAPLMTAAAAITAFWLTDVAGVLRLNRTLAGLAVLAALALAFWRSRGLSGEMLLWNIAHLLIVLQMIMFFQEKEGRTYGQTLILSLLLVMVATLFNQTALFGLVLVLYALAGLSTSVLLFLVKEHREFASAGGSPGTAPQAERMAGEATTWSVCVGSPRSALRGDLLRCLTSMAVFTLIFSMFLFFTTPRLGYGAWRGAGGSVRTAVGFSDSVILGEMGEMLEDPQIVLQLTLLDAATREVYRAQGEVYLRGAVLGRYDRGRWWAWTSGWGDMHPAPPLPFDELPEAKVVQRIVIEPMDRGELFCIWPFVVLDETSDVTFDSRTQRLLRNEKMRQYRFEYELGTTGFAQRRQSVWVPCTDYSPDWRAERRLLQSPWLPRLQALAEQWLAEAEVDRRDRAACARLFESRLRDSGMFAYSLHGTARNTQIDPIEDFVSENRVGHCEYFATALALMLRSQGIPSRVVVGYRSDEWNEFSRRFIVRQLHAHAWVEAKIPFDQLPEELRTGESRWQWANGAWLRLDPTPASADPAESAVWAYWDRWQQWWSGYILDMDRQRQYEAVYRPLRDVLERWWKALSDGDRWRQRWASLVEAFRAASIAARVFSVVVSVVALALILVALVSTVRWMMRRRGRRTAPRGLGADCAVAFFARCERLLRKARCQRIAGQTQREFLRRAAEELVARGASVAVVGELALIGEAFYQVRFGGRPLDAAAMETVERALADVETHLRNLQRSRAASHGGE